jgi:hypothetical protein
MIPARAVAIFWLAAGIAAAQTAKLECSGAKKDGPGVRLTFRKPPAEKMRVEKATLWLHLKDKEPPAKIVVNGKGLPATPQADGWVTVEVPGKEAQKPLSVGEAARFDGAGTAEHAPYLVVEGPMQVRTK